MTLTDDQATTTATHPLDPVTGEEIAAARRILADAVRFDFFALEEPAKDEVLAFTLGAPVDRRFRVLLLDLSDGSSRDCGTPSA